MASRENEEEILDSDIADDAAGIISLINHWFIPEKKRRIIR